MVQHNRIINVQSNSIKSEQHNRIMETRSLKEAGHGQTPGKTRAVPRNPAEPPDRGRGWGDPGARPVTHAPGAPPAQRLPARSHKGLVYPEPPGRSGRREHDLVRIVLALLRRVSGSAFWRAVVPFTGTIALTPCRQLDRARPACGAVATRGQQGHQTPAWHVLAGPSHRAAGCGGPEGRGWPAAVLGGICPDRVLPQLFFEQRDGCTRGVADDTGRLRPSRPAP